MNQSPKISLRGAHEEKKEAAFREEGAVYVG